MNNHACRTEGTLDSFFCFSEFFSMSSCVSLERSNHLQGDWDSIIYGDRGNHFSCATRQQVARQFPIIRISFN